MRACVLLPPLVLHRPATPGPEPLTWLQHPDLQQVGGPLGQPRPGVVVVLPPQLRHTLVLARLRVTGSADAQAHVVAGLGLLDGRPGSEAGGPIPPLDPSVPGEGHQVVELDGAHRLEPPGHRHGDPGRVMGFDDALQVEGVAVGHPRRAGDGCDCEARFWGESRGTQARGVTWLSQGSVTRRWGSWQELAGRAKAQGSVLAPRPVSRELSRGSTNPPFPRPHGRRPGQLSLAALLIPPRPTMELSRWPRDGRSGSEAGGPISICSPSVPLAGPLLETSGFWANARQKNPRAILFIPCEMTTSPRTQRPPLPGPPVHQLWRRGAGPVEGCPMFPHRAAGVGHRSLCTFLVQSREEGQ